MRFLLALVSIGFAAQFTMAAQSICPQKISIQTEKYAVQISDLKDDKFRTLSATVNGQKEFAEWKAQTTADGQSLVIVNVAITDAATRVQNLEITLNRVNGEVISVVYHWHHDIDFGYGYGDETLQFKASSSCK